MARRRLRVGERVRASADPSSGTLGRVARRCGPEDHELESTSYLVCWESGGESWNTRASLQPLCLRDPPASGPSRFRRLFARVAADVGAERVDSHPRAGRPMA